MKWNQEITWTLEMATKLVDLIDEYDGSCDAVDKLRSAIRTKAPYVSQRAGVAFEEAREIIKQLAESPAGYRQFLREVKAIVSEGEGSNREDLSDWIQDTVIDRAAQLEKTAYRIAQDCFHAVSEDHINDYLRRRKSMGSHKLQHVLRVLRLKVVAE